MIPFHRDGTDLVAELDDFEVALVTSLVAQVNELIGGAGEPAASDDPFARWARELRSEPLDRSDPVVLLGSLINATVPNRLTVVFDSSHSDGSHVYLAGARAADSAAHPELRAEINRLQDLGYLAG